MGGPDPDRVVDVTEQVERKIAALLQHHSQHTDPTGIADTHPALIQLFVQAAKHVHGGAGWFQHKGDFPTAYSAEHPLAKEAQRFYANGAPLLQHYLPFWLANLVERMWPVLLSIVAILIPASRLLPPLYEFRIRSRVFRWYAQLRAVEDAQGQRPAAELLAELTDIETRVAGITVPLSY